MDALIWHSRLPAVEVVSAFVDEEVLREAARHPSRQAVTDAATGRSLTFAQLADGSRRLAAGLAARGLGRGDVVSIVAANHVDYPLALYGALAAGAAVASANPALTARELHRQFAKTRPRLVFADARSREVVVAALAGAGSAAAVYQLGDGGDAPSIADLLATPTGEPIARDPGDAALLSPSSGTTGLPKIAVHTHAGTTAFFQAFATAPGAQCTPTDVLAVVVPFTHMYGTGMLTHGLRSGASVVTIAGAGFDLDRYLRMLQDYAVTVAPVGPPVLLALARHPLVDRFDLSSLRLVITAGAPCPSGWQDEVEYRLACRVVDVLGATEAWCYAVAAEPHVRGSCGTVGANLQAAVIDPATGGRIGPGQPGELMIRGPQLMAGYLGDDAATAAAIDRDGWLHTGDVCSLDAGGNVFIVDRLKELIKVGGYSVAPAEVERELQAHPAVADAAVVGRPDPELGEVPVAYVALRAEVEPNELMVWLEGRLAPWKLVRDVVVIERVPRDPTGKVLRRELIDRERAAAQSVS